MIAVLSASAATSSSRVETSTTWSSCRPDSLARAMNCAGVSETVAQCSMPSMGGLVPATGSGSLGSGEGGVDAGGAVLGSGRSGCGSAAGARWQAQQHAMTSNGASGCMIAWLVTPGPGITKLHARGRPIAAGRRSDQLRSTARGKENPSLGSLGTMIGAPRASDQPTRHRSRWATGGRPAHAAPMAVGHGRATSPRGIAHGEGTAGSQRCEHRSRGS